MSVRPATVEDLPAIADMARRMHDEAPAYRDWLYDAEKVKVLLRTLLDSGACLLVSEHDGIVRGGIAGICTTHWFSTEKIATDLALFIDREYRNGTTAIRLIHGFVEWARLVGAKRVSMGITTGVNPDSSARLYVAAGLHAQGVVFSKEFAHVHGT